MVTMQLDCSYSVHMQTRIITSHHHGMLIPLRPSHEPIPTNIGKILFLQMFTCGDTCLGWHIHIKLEHTDQNMRTRARKHMNANIPHDITMNCC